jgi:cytochrome c-type biogenesis protein
VAAQPSLWLAFGAGLLSFISPCCLPLYPSYLSYISGITFASVDTPTIGRRLRALSHTVFFVLGFSSVFVALGLSASAFGQWFAEFRDVIRVVGGLIVITMGLVLSGVFTPGWVMREHRWQYSARGAGYLTSLLVGISFAAGWTPCIGPILASVLVLTATHAANGLILITAYILGFAIPFFILAFTLGSVRWLARYGAILQRWAGVLLVVMGIALTFNLMSRITAWLVQLSGGFTGF